jgi:hypothetical protein
VTVDKSCGQVRCERHFAKREVMVRTPDFNGSQRSKPQSFEVSGRNAFRLARRHEHVNSPVFICKKTKRNPPALLATKEYFVNVNSS